MRILILCSIFLLSISASHGQTILDFLKSKPANFTYAVQAISIANLTTELQSGGPFTAFIPTDDAFQRLPGAELTKLLGDPVALRNLLLGHVTAGVTISPFITGNKTGSSLINSTLHYSKDASGFKVNGVNVVMKDNIVSNGVVQGIDGVLKVPFKTKDNIVEYLLKHPNQFKDLTAVLTIADLLNTLEGPGPFTLFAPTNDAFQKLAGTLQSIAADRALLKTILTYHVVSGQLMAADLKNGQQLMTVAGKNLTVSTTNGVLVDHAHVTKADISTVNGIIHVIDGLLVPN